MATFAIGDVQGCMDELDALLAACAFDPARDRAWFVGDLVNRGPASLEVLRFVKGLGAAATVVLGNHDLHLLCVAEGFAKTRPDDTLEPILASPEREALLGWLRTRQLMHVEGNKALVHAGLLPHWNLARALELAREFESALSGPGYRDLLAHLYGSEPSEWSDDLQGADRMRVIVNAMTRMRFCTGDGKMEFRAKGSIEAAPPGYRAWFDVPRRLNADATIVCGHWSALGLRIERGLMALDTGCIWGGALSAVRLEDRKVFQVPGSGHRTPGAD